MPVFKCPYLNARIWVPVFGCPYSSANGYMLTTLYQ